MTRNEALAAGLATYRTGKPCRNGHDAPRYSSCGVCVNCLRESRYARVRLANVALANRTSDGALFAYKLHPEDHAAALAYCQALDMTRGRVPALACALALPDLPPPGPFQLPDIIAERRAQLVAQLAPAPAPRHMSDEMARHLSDER